MVFMRQQKTSPLTSASRSKGFTLFEILIVIGILGGLMAFIIKKVNDSAQLAKAKNTKIAISQLVQALTMYQSDCQKFPTALEGLSKADGCNNWGGPYSKEIPPDGWGRKFIYESDGGNYSLKSLGADNKEGGDGVNKDLTAEDLQ